MTTPSDSDLLSEPTLFPGFGPRRPGIDYPILVSALANDRVLYARYGGDMSGKYYHCMTVDQLNQVIQLVFNKERSEHESFNKTRGMYYDGSIFYTTDSLLARAIQTDMYIDKYDYIREFGSRYGGIRVDIIDTTNTKVRLSKDIRYE